MCIALISIRNSNPNISYFPIIIRVFFNTGTGHHLIIYKQSSIDGSFLIYFIP